MKDLLTADIAHYGACHFVVGQRRSTCAFCFCESSWDAGEGIVTCWACARAIIEWFWNWKVNPEPAARAQDGWCYTHCPEN